jgi:hypothetical protein
VLAAIRRKDAPALAEVASEVPAALAKLVDRCLLTDRAERFKDGGEMAEALQAALCSAAADPTPAEPPPPETKKPATPAAPPPAMIPEEIPASRPRRSGAIAGLFLLAGAAALGATIATFMTRDPTPTAPLAPAKPTSGGDTAITQNHEPRTTAPAALTQAGATPSSTPEVRPVVQATSAAASSTSTPATRPAATTTRGGGKPLTQVNEAGF